MLLPNPGLSGNWLNFWHVEKLHWFSKTIGVAYLLKLERDLLDIWEERAHRHQISNLIIVQRSGLYNTRVPEGYCSLISWSLPLLEAHPNPQELKLLYRSKMTTTYFQTIHKHVCILMLTISLDDPNCVNYYSFLQTVWLPLNSHPIRDFFFIEIWQEY